MQSNDDDLLGRLIAAEVELIVVGMAAAVLQGAPMVTADIDIVHRRSPDNVARLLGLLRDLDAVYRTDRRGLAPQTSHLVGESRAGSRIAPEMDVSHAVSVPSPSAR